MDRWMDGWLEMRNYSAYRILCLTYTALKENTRRLRSSQSLLLSNQKCNLDTYGKRRFSVSAYYCSFCTMIFAICTLIYRI